MAEDASGPRLAGARLRLRPFGEADIGDTYLGWLNDPAVVRFSNQRFRRHDQASAGRYLASFAGGPSHFLLVSEAATGRPVGTLTAHVQPLHGTADMGILIGARECWGRGYGLEAWQLLMDWLFAERALRKVTAGTAAPNVSMRRIAERSGMHLEAVRRRQEIIDGVEADILLYAKFRHG
jgi:RimJ/RimL family protein N-acetyltransferase